MDKDEFVKEFIHELSYSFLDKSVIVHTSFGYVNADWFVFSMLEGYVDLYLKKRFVAEIQLKRIKRITEGYKITRDWDKE
jgi:hypothetical protein